MGIPVASVTELAIPAFQIKTITETATFQKEAKMFRHLAILTIGIFIGIGGMVVPRGMVAQNLVTPTAILNASCNSDTSSTPSQPQPATACEDPQSRRAAIVIDLPVGVNTQAEAVSVIRSKIELLYSGIHQADFPCVIASDNRGHFVLEVEYLEKDRKRWRFYSSDDTAAVTELKIVLLKRRLENQEMERSEMEKLKREAEQNYDSAGDAPF